MLGHPSTLEAGEWSHRYDARFVKQTIKPKVKALPGPDVLSGEPVVHHDPVLPSLQGLATKRGWHKRDGLDLPSMWHMVPRTFGERSLVLKLPVSLSGPALPCTTQRDVVYGRKMAPLDSEASVLRVSKPKKVEYLTK